MEVEDEEVEMEVQDEEIEVEDEGRRQDEEYMLNENLKRIIIIIKRQK